MTVLKILGDEISVGTSATSLGSRTVRLVNPTAGARTITVEDIVTVVAVTVDTSANDSLLLPVTSGNTAAVKPGYSIVNASNTAVVNTDLASVVTSVNSTAVVANVDIVIANGVTEVALSRGQYTFTLASNTDIVIYTGALATLTSNNASDVLGTPVSVNG